MREGARRARLPRQERAVLLLLALELALFALLVDRFATLGNAMEIVRSGTELGLLALAMTLVMKSGGIDLSVGSTMGLVAVTLGAASAAGVPIAAAALLAITVGAAAGLGNGLLVTRLRVPPLIVTLATMALYRGLAEGFTGGYTTWTAWPAGFLALGQGYLLGFLPAQLPLFLAASLLAWLAMHRSPFGRRITAIGFAPEGAAHAGVPVARCLLQVYLIAGAAAGVAGVLYVAHIGQAKADAGTGYELMVITMVVLGGTSIDGGRGTVAGTLLGLFTITVLQNGLLLAGLPGELAAVLVGVVLVMAVVFEKAQVFAPAASHTASSADELDVKNSQVAAIIAAILGAAILVAGSNWLLVGTMLEERSGPVARRIVVGMMPKAKSDPYFVSCRTGAETAARELAVDLIWDGPTDLDPARQNEVVEAWITRGVDVIAVSVENRDAISTVLRKARGRGIPVLTWDADAQPDARDFLINQATPQGIGYALADEAARVLGGKGRYAIVTATLTAANQNEWIRYIKERCAASHPGLELVDIRPSDGQRDKALSATKNLLRAHPDLSLIVAIAAPAVPGAAEAVKQEGSTAKVIGLSVPSLCRDYVHAGIIESIVLWNTIDLGYLTVHAAAALASGQLRRGVDHLDAGRLGRIEVAGDEVRLGKPFRFDKSNIDDFDF